MVSSDTAKKIEEKRFLDNLFSDMKQLLPYLDDAKVTNISILDSGEIIVDKFGEGRIFTGEQLDSTTARRIIFGTASILEKRVDLLDGFPKLEGVIPVYNARIQGILPPSTIRPNISIRKPPTLIYTLENYVETKRITQENYELVVEYIKNRKNLLIGGGTGSGKTTFLNAVIKKMEEFAPDDNFYIVEDVAEIQCKAKMKTMICVAPHKAAEAVRSALRMQPDRIIFGEVRYGEVANELFKSWNTGHCGNATTVHADNCLSMLTRFKSLLREVIVGELPKISEGIHLCVHLNRSKNGPIVDEVMSTMGIDADGFINAIEMNNLG